MLWARDGPSVVWVLVAANLFVAAMYHGRNHRQSLDGSDLSAGATNTLSQAPGASPLPVEKRAGCKHFPYPPPAPIADRRLPPLPPRPVALT